MRTAFSQLYNAERILLAAGARHHIDVNQDPLSPINSRSSDSGWRVVSGSCFREAVCATRDGIPLEA